MISCYWLFHCGGREASLYQGWHHATAVVLLLFYSLTNKHISVEKLLLKCTLSSYFTFWKRVIECLFRIIWSLFSKC